MVIVTYKQLGQLRPADANAASIYSPAAGVTAVIRLIVVCETGGGGVTYRIFCDDDGTTYDQTTALVYDVALGANAYAAIVGLITMNDSSGNLAVRTDTADDVTFTVFGSEVTS